MGFFNNIGTKTYDDIENYIKNREWEDNKNSNNTNPNAWSWDTYTIEDSYEKTGSDWSIEKGPESYILKLRVDIWGHVSKVDYDIKDIIDELFAAMIDNKPIEFSVSTQYHNTDRDQKFKYKELWDISCSFRIERLKEPGDKNYAPNFPWINPYTLEKEIELDTTTVKVKKRTDDYFFQNNDYNKKQQKLARRHFNKW